jgi:hypothetical protein
MGFYNYASPRVRREAKPQVAAIHALSLKMYSSLLAARRSDAVTLNLKVQQCEEYLDRAQQDLAERDARIAELEAQLLTQSNSP